MVWRCNKIICPVYVSQSHALGISLSAGRPNACRRRRSPATSRTGHGRAGAGRACPAGGTRARLLVMGSLPDVPSCRNCSSAAWLYSTSPIPEQLPAGSARWCCVAARISPTANAEYLLAVQAGRAGWQLDTEGREVLRQCPGFARGNRPDAQGVGAAHLQRVRTPAPQVRCRNQRTPHRTGSRRRVSAVMVNLTCRTCDLAGILRARSGKFSLSKR